MALTDAKPAALDPWDAISTPSRRKHLPRLPKPGPGRTAALAVAGVLLAAGLTAWFTGMELAGARSDAGDALEKAVAAAQPRTDLSVQLTQVLLTDAPLERGAIDQVISARNKVMVNNPGTDGSGRNFSRYAGAEADLAASLDHLVKVAQTHPKLKTAAAFTDLVKQLDAAAPGITEATSAYNAAAGRYNDVRDVFPANVLAPLLGHEAPFGALTP